MSEPKAGIVSKLDSGVSGWISGWNPYDPKKLQGRGIEPVQVEESKIRKNAATCTVAAPGTSCRHQIKDGTAVKAVHPIEVLYDALVK